VRWGWLRGCFSKGSFYVQEVFDTAKGTLNDIRLRGYILTPNSVVQALDAVLARANSLAILRAGLTSTPTDTLVGFVAMPSKGGYVAFKVFPTPSNWEVDTEMCWLGWWEKHRDAEGTYIIKNGKILYRKLWLHDQTGGMKVLYEHGYETCDTSSFWARMLFSSNGFDVFSLGDSLFLIGDSAGYPVVMTWSSEPDAFPNPQVIYHPTLFDEYSYDFYAGPKVGVWAKADEQQGGKLLFVFLEDTTWRLDSIGPFKAPLSTPQFFEGSGVVFTYDPGDSVGSIEFAEIPARPAFLGPRFPFALLPPSPNPSKGAFTVVFSVPGEGPYSLRLYDMAGRRVFTVAEGKGEPGLHRVEVNPELPAGVYVMRLVYNDWLTKERKVVRVR